MNIYKKLDYLLFFVFYIFNIFSRVYQKLNYKISRLLKHNKELRRNKDYCFILGNGPSLKNVDLLKLNGEDTFAVNYFYKHCPEGFKSRFFVAIDQNFYTTKQREYIFDLYEQEKDVTFILKTPAYDLKENWNMNRTFFIFPKLFQYGDFVAVDTKKDMTASINVVLQCIQIALGMGYKEIFLLGCDFTQYAEMKSHHFYDTKNDDDRRGLTNMGDDARWAYLAHYHHYALQEYAKKHGQKIINLTENSLIDAYEFGSFDNVINEIGK